MLGTKLGVVVDDYDLVYMVWRTWDDMIGVFGGRRVSRL
jgi:hypothetical protein